MILKYLKEKPYGQQFLTDHLIIGLLACLFTSIAFLSSAIILRELFGPYSISVSWCIILVQQFLQLVVVMTLLSIRVAQFCNIFFINR
jgi:hypothetical protein